MNNYVENIAKNSKIAFKELSNSSIDQRNSAIINISELIKKNSSSILDANELDLKKAKEKNITGSFLDRLTLNKKRIDDMCNGLQDIANLEDPLGIELEKWKRPNGLVISKMSVPLGIIGIIYESRPNVTIDAGSLCIKSGNASILRGGSDSFNSSKYLTELIQEGLNMANLPKDSVQSINQTDRKLVTQMLQAINFIDVIVPRGGKSLISKIQKEARVPVFAHLEGICHVYIDREIDFKVAKEVLINSKLRRTGICGAAETLLLDKKLDEKILDQLINELLERGCEVRGDEIISKKFCNVVPATEEDWKTEYLDSIISVKVVDGVNGAINHINKFSSNHTDTIITNNNEKAENFLSKVDSAIVIHNASTQFADGGEFGMGAEIGISTGRLHARGPVGSKQLTSFKYIIRGSGQVRKV